ncbi:9271_t:CDS:2 [Entrophospora sp. SA101]|nr:9271_t:CDS:2 [Entrophospora sp. SA101]
MTEKLQLQPNDKVLEIGTGSGFQTAILAQLVKEVYTIEIYPELSQKAQKLLTQLGYQSIFCHQGNGSLEIASGEQILYLVKKLTPEKIQSIPLLPIRFISIAKKALQKSCFNYHVYNIRNWAIRGQVDDYIYGGGSGMLLKIDCLVKTLAAVYENHGKDCYVILLSPQGKRFTQKDVERLIQKKNLVFICGHYEGIDERVNNYIDEQISVGDFVTSGGEVPALLITETLIRALPGVLSPEAYQNETFQTENSFDFASYTRDFVRIKDSLISVETSLEKIREHLKKPYKGIVRFQAKTSEQISKERYDKVLEEVNFDYNKLHD